ALGDAYLAAGRLNDAAKTYQAVLSKDANNVAALNGLGYVLFSSGEMHGALVAADRVLTLRPKDPDALFLKGLIEYRAEDWKGAVSQRRKGSGRISRGGYVVPPEHRFVNPGVAVRTAVAALEISRTTPFLRGGGSY